MLAVMLLGLLDPQRSGTSYSRCFAPCPGEHRLSRPHRRYPSAFVESTLPFTPRPILGWMHPHGRSHA